MFFFINEESDEMDKQSIIDLFQMSGDTQTAKNNEPSIMKTLMDMQKEKSEVKEEVPESYENSSTTPQGMPENKIEMRRQKGRIRSKKSRDRKKQYLEELEDKVKDLEKENSKLRQEIEQLKVSIAFSNIFIFNFYYDFKCNLYEINFLIFLQINFFIITSSNFFILTFINIEIRN